MIGRALRHLVLLFGVANAVAHILASLHWLPEYR